MDIPDEAFPGANQAWKPAADVAWRGWAAAVVAAAPHIARAAQVRILREVVEEIRQSEWTSLDEVGAVVARGTALHIARTIELKADELESP